MAALAHAAVGFAAKRVAPSVPLWVLLAGAYLIDVVWTVFWLLGYEHFPTPGIEVPAPWSHSLVIACLLSALAFGAASLYSRRLSVRVLSGVLVFSHWLVDFITQPMGAAFPGAGFRMRVFFGESPTIVGLGLYNSKVALNLVEYGVLPVGVAIYWLAVRRAHGERKQRAPKIADS